MPIPISQLETWSHQGAITTSAATRQAVYNAIAAHPTLSQKSLDTYLQGSYGNDTNVWASSDVDVVVQHNRFFFHDTSALPPEQEAAFQRSLAGGSCTVGEFRAEVEAGMRSYFGSAVHPRNKCIHIDAASGRQPADVVPCFPFKRYTYFRSLFDCGGFEGLRFQGASDGRWITNYPKLHMANGTAKHQRTGGGYKPVVRMFKNARNRLVEMGVIGDGLAPSYFVECLLYNLSDAAFMGGLDQCYVQVIKSMDPKSWPQYVAQNEQSRLFGTAPEQWSIDHAATFMSAMIELWNGW